MRSFILLSAVLALAACDDVKVKHSDKASGHAETATAPAADAARLEADLRFLADDLLEGRETGTRGYDIAANYVAEQYRAIGVLPGGDDGGYFQKVPLRGYKNTALNGGMMTLSGEGAPRRFLGGADYAIEANPMSEQGAVEAPLVFAGFGLVTEDGSRNDFEGLDLDGKIAVILLGAPKYLHSEERAYYTNASAAKASELGAIGLISVYTPTFESRRGFQTLTKARKGETRVKWMGADGVPFSNTPNIEVHAIASLEGAEALFANTQQSWAEISAAAEAEAGAVEGFDMGMTARIEYASAHEEIISSNVVGIIPGTDPALRDEYVILTGHLDHIGIKPTDEEGDDELHNGAMDNATGIAAMLEVARLMAPNPPKRSLIFIAFTGEEKGLIGSSYYAKNPTVDAGAIVANVNLDMPVLSFDFTDVVAFGGERSTMFPVIEAAAERANLKLSPDPQPDMGIFTRTDHFNFVRAGVPAVYLTPGFANGGGAAMGVFFANHYHKPSDEIPLVSIDGLRRFADVNYEIALGVANMEARPLWKKDDFFGTLFEGDMEE